MDDNIPRGIKGATNIVPKPLANLDELEDSEETNDN